MKPEDIGLAYNTLTDLWEGNNFNRDNGIAQHKRAIPFATNHRLALDVGCGSTGRFIDLLLTNGFSPQGVDISTEMIRLARLRHPDITFHQQDICNWVLPDKYDFISAWDSIWHVPLERQAAVLSKLFNSLNPGGVCIFSGGGTDKPDDHKDSTMGTDVYYSTLGITGFLTVIEQSGCICRHLEYDQHPELHCYFIVQKIG
ncbi:class I SAM-dependent methyltransferase [Amphritea japonica]|uniref:Type 11 methyltransferase n=1 Tax=Amphritea japonica ATCC BAA-1530 TaxID=1278309 RepID=A0A7R6PC50_9GAMM|nr:class I SAM-dependent methyltransferase [Amphritea japonica]BBB26678.1 type 11 methyltransferase [Amphritea japonica ATCC BAA-1530]